jgi:DNA-binding beta-propeller fold protein YncE
VTRRSSAVALALGVAALMLCLVLAAVVTAAPSVASPARGSAASAAPALTLSPASGASAARASTTSPLSIVQRVASAALPPTGANGSANSLCCHVIANPATQDRPAGMAVDTGANLVFISNWGSGTVTVLSGTYPFAPVSWSPVTVGTFPNGEAYDPNNCTVWVTNWASDSISIISDGSSALHCGGPATAGQVATVSMPATNEGPYGIAYDAQDQVMLVTDRGYGPVPQNVTVFCAQANGYGSGNTACSGNGPTTIQLYTIYGQPYPSTSLGPTYVAWDPVDDYFVATNPTGQGTVPEADLFECFAASCSLTSHWTFGLGVGLPAGSGPSGIAYAGTGTFGSLSGGTGTFWVADGGSDAVTVLCTYTSSVACHGSAVLEIYTTFAAPTGTTPGGVLFFWPCNEVFVTGFTGNDVLVYPDQPASPPASPPSVPVGDGPLAAVFDGEVFVSNYGQNAAGNGNGNVSVILCSMCNATPCDYTITFNETGLPVGTSWDVDLNGMDVNATVTTTGTGTTITFYGLCVGSYTYVVSVPPGYSTTNPSGVANIPASQPAGSEVYVYVPFTSPCDYTVTFNETGLPTGSTWDVSLNGTSMSATVTTTGLGTTITFSGLCAGTYNYTVSVPKGYTANPSSGQVTIPVGLPAGSEVYQTIAFQNLEFVEKGLPNGTGWDVTISGHGLPNGTETKTTNGTLISFSVPKGTYKYTVSKPCEYAAKPLSGAVTVGATVKTVPVTFTLLTKAVKFHETGLPAGTKWAVTVTGPEPFSPFAIVTTTYSSTSPTISITTVCGNYSWNTSNVATHGAIYAPTPSSGTFQITVTGNTITKVPPANPIAIHFVP